MKSNSTPSYISKGTERTCLYPKEYNTETCIWIFIVALIIKAKSETSQVYTNGWMDKQNVAYTYTMKHYSAIKKNGMLIHAITWIHLKKHYAE